MRRLALFACLAMCSSAVAQTPPPKPNDPKMEEAKSDYESGRRAYNLGDFDGAIDQWKAGYKLTGEGYFLYNVAQAYRMKKDYAQALFFYKSYLRENPNAENRDAVNDKITEMEKLAATSPTPTPTPDTTKPTPTQPVKPQPTQPQPVKPQPQPPPQATVPPPVAPTHPGRGLDISGGVVGGVGAVLIVGGAIFAAGASSTQSDLEKQANLHDPNTQSVESQEAHGRSQATNARVFFGIGAVGIVGGAVLYAVGAHAAHVAAERSAMIVPVVGPGVAALSFSTSF